MVFGWLRNIGKAAFNTVKNIAKLPSTLTRHVGKAIDFAGKVGNVADTVSKVASAAQEHINPDSKIGKLVAGAQKVAGQVSNGSQKFVAGAGKANEFLGNLG